MTRTSIRIEHNGVVFHHTGAGPWKVRQESYGYRFSVINERGENKLRVEGVKPHPAEFIFFALAAAQTIAEALNVGASAGAPPSSFYGATA